MDTTLYRSVVTCKSEEEEEEKESVKGEWGHYCNGQDIEEIEAASNAQHRTSSALVRHLLLGDEDDRVVAAPFVPGMGSESAAASISSGMLIVSPCGYRAGSTGVYSGGSCAVVPAGVPLALALCRLPCPRLDEEDGELLLPIEDRFCRWMSVMCGVGGLRVCSGDEDSEGMSAAVSSSCDDAISSELPSESESLGHSGPRCL